ncbi:MAG: hypothetical protein SOZ00_08425 [Tidjanibacter sp.]|nr:hypothetical protein [Tidjanibacter sp.]
MKKLFTILLILAATSFVANAQSAKKTAAKKTPKTTCAFSQGNNVVGASIGFGLPGALIGLSYERGFENDLFGVSGLNLGAGAVGGFYSYANSSSNNGVTVNTSSSVINIMLRGALHYQFVKNLDTYVALNVGASHVEAASEGSSHGYSTGGSTSNTGFGGGLLVGARYYFLPYLGAGAEFGFGSAVAGANLCVFFKF